MMSLGKFLGRRKEAMKSKPEDLPEDQLPVVPGNNGAMRCDVVNGDYTGFGGYLSPV